MENLSNIGSQDVILSEDRTSDQDAMVEVEGHVSRHVQMCLSFASLKITQIFCFTFLILGTCFTPQSTHAQALTYQFQEKIFTIMPLQEWKRTEDAYTYKGREVRFEGEAPAGVTKTVQTIWDAEKIAESLQSKIADELNRDAGTVRISRDEENTILFDGLALPGRTVDVALAAKLTITALENNIPIIQLPVQETDPTVIVEDAALKKMGIKELVSVGESDYTGSPSNRKHNIALGLSKFNGVLIEKDAEFSFNHFLGRVDSSAGYLRELTIVGDKTLPEYGGGLCQVSTTAYRGVWKAGFPISDRRNHSYAVRYYSPAGTDATIYPPWTDMKFINDTDGALLIQTHHEDNKAYFLYYGTKPKNRSVELIGPFNWDVQPPPSDRKEYTTDIPAGTVRIVSKQVPGMKNAWYRYITNGDDEPLKEEFYSYYEARPYFEQIGIAASTLEPKPTIIFIEEEEPIITPNAIPRRGERIRTRRL